MDQMTPSIQMINLSKKYRQTIALKAIDLTLPANQIIGILGASGAGKTTIVKLIANLVNRYQGELLLFGEKPSYKTRCQVSICPEVSTFLPRDTTDDVITFWDAAYPDFDMIKAHRLLQEQHINPFDAIETLPFAKQRIISVILALSRNTEIYILDDPFKTMNESEQLLMIDFLKNNIAFQKTTIIASTYIHQIDKILDFIVFIQEGCLMKTWEPKKSHYSLKRMYDEVMV